MLAARRGFSRDRRPGRRAQPSTEAEMIGIFLDHNARDLLAVRLFKVAQFEAAA